MSGDRTPATVPVREPGLTSYYRARYYVALRSQPDTPATDLAAPQPVRAPADLASGCPASNLNPTTGGTMATLNRVTVLASTDIVTIHDTDGATLAYATRDDEGTWSGTWSARRRNGGAFARLLDKDTATGRAIGYALQGMEW